MRRISILAMTIVASACSANAGGNGETTRTSEAPLQRTAPPRKIVHPMRGTAPKQTADIPIEYNGGYVMGGTVDVYLLWYGDWSGWAATTILPDFIQHLGGSPYYAINTTYGDQYGRQVTNSINLAGSYADSYSRGTSLSDADIQGIVSDAIGSGNLPLDVHGVYFVLTSDDVSQGGFCDGYCGYHSNEVIGDTYVKYTFVGNPAQCPSGCEPQAAGPNGSASADGMASIMAHELEESASDPYGDAWFDANGDENGDKCAWTFGDEYTAANGALANMRLGDRDYLIQQNWVNAGGGYCALSY